MAWVSRSLGRGGQRSKLPGMQSGIYVLFQRLLGTLQLPQRCCFVFAAHAVCDTINDVTSGSVLRDLQRVQNPQECPKFISGIPHEDDGILVARAFWGGAILDIGLRKRKHVLKCGRITCQQEPMDLGSSFRRR